MKILNWVHIMLLNSILLLDYILVLFIHHLFHLLLSLASSEYLSSLSNACPSSLHSARKILSLLDDQFIEYVVCPTCYQTFAESYNYIIMHAGPNSFLHTLNERAQNNLGRNEKCHSCYREAVWITAGGDTTKEDTSLDDGWRVPTDRDKSVQSRHTAIC